ncbi:hypothetical protein STEG23_011344, partial [Scotinomys teguina]
VDVNIKLWKNGFTVNDDFRSYSDGASQQFLNSIKKGELPSELRGVFDKEEVDVKVEDKKNEVCVSTKPVFQPFSGQGHRLGSATPKIISKAKSIEVENKSAMSAVSLNNLEPVTRIQIWLVNGERIVQRFNISHSADCPYPEEQLSNMYITPIAAGLKVTRSVPPTHQVEQSILHTLTQRAQRIVKGRRIQCEESNQISNDLSSPSPGGNGTQQCDQGIVPQLYLYRALGCMPFIALAYFFLWLVPPFTSLRGLWYTTFYCLFQALTTFFQVPYTALTMILTPSPRERDSATAYRMTMEMAGTLMGAAVHGFTVSSANGSRRCEGPGVQLPGSTAVSPDAARLYCIAAAVVALTYPVCGSLLCLGVKEQPATSAPASGSGLSFFTGLAITSRHPPYLNLVVSFLFISAAVQVEQSYLVLFCLHASRLQDHVQGLVLTILISAVLSTPLWEWVLQRFGKRTSAFGICVMVPFSILLAAVPSAPVAYVVAFVSGVSIAVSLLLPWSMLPDVVDDFQLQHQHGPGVETIFYSSYVFFTKLAGAGALGISTLSLESVPGLGYTGSTKDQGTEWGEEIEPLLEVTHESGVHAPLYGVWGTPIIRTKEGTLDFSLAFHIPNLSRSQFSGEGGGDMSVTPVPEESHDLQS